MDMAINQRRELDLAAVFRACGHDFAKQHELCPVQQKAWNDILICRTLQAGGHINRCNRCGHERQAYNSCRNRHCPKCQFIKQEQWVDKLRGRLIPGRYFHVVFTVPALLNPLFCINQRICYHLLFQSAWEALQKAGRNPQFLGAEPGAVAVLHTWGQTLSYHPHLHMLVPAGGLSEDGTEWIRSPKRFFVPVKALSMMFRAILVRKLEEQIRESRLKLPEGFTGLDALKKELYQKNWNVYSKKAFGGVSSVLSYLGRYTHRVAITNNRLMGMEEGKVTFSYRDYRKDNRNRSMTLDVEEFARRFLQHILPCGFYKIRYLGILATAHVHTKREQSISLVGKTMYLPVWEGLTAYEVLRELTGKDPARCPKCKTGFMIRDRDLAAPG
ncbi:MAG: IS91 family transposase [Mangrovibacterium sp.]